MTTPTRRELQAQERRNQLVATALKLFAEKGVENTSIKDIATEAGVAQGLIYHYFRSKDHLLDAIIGQYNPVPELGKILLNADERPAREVLTEVGMRAYQLLDERSEVTKVVFREAFTRAEIRRGFRMLQAVGISLLTRYLTARIAAGELRPHDPEVTARMLVGSLIALRLTDMPAEPFIHDVVDMILRGVATS